MAGRRGSVILGGYLRFDLCWDRMLLPNKVNRLHVTNDVKHKVTSIIVKRYRKYSWVLLGHKIQANLYTRQLYHRQGLCLSLTVKYMLCSKLLAIKPLFRG